MSDIPIPKNDQLAMYVDDIAIYTSSHYPNDIVKDLNNTLKDLREYFLKWKIKINAGKLEAIIFPMNRQQRRPLNQILYDDEIVHIEKSIKYLGITLDEMLTFKDHINAEMHKAIIYFQKFSPILRSSSFSTETKLLLFTTIIRPIMAHGSPICSWAPPNVLKKLYILQQRFLKMFLNLPSRFSTKFVEKRYHIPRLSCYLSRINKKFAKKCKESEFKLIRDIDHLCCRMRISHKNYKNVKNWKF